MEPGRRLSIIPIIHADEDLGSAATRVRRAHEERGSAAARDALIRGLWSQIETWVRTVPMSLPAARVHVYQDGLPVCPPGWPGERRIVEDLASRGSRNHALVLALVRRGATLWGTENPELLMKEYQVIRGDAKGVDVRALLVERDRFIANRINQTLPAGGVGVLFVGAAHDPGPGLAPDVLIEYPLGRPKAGSTSGDSTDAAKP